MSETRKNKTEQSLNESEAILADILLKFSSRDKSVSVDDFIREQLVASGDFSEKDAQETASVISRTIASNSQNRREIQDYKKKGRSSAIWLRDFIDRVTAPFSSEARSHLIESLKNAFNKSNLEMANQMSDEKVEEVVSPLETTDFEDPINKNNIANNLKEEIEMNALLRFMEYGKLETVVKKGESK